MEKIKNRNGGYGNGHSFLEIRIRGTDKTWPNASPQLTMIGSKIWLSYGIGSMNCVLYEQAEDMSELKDAVLSWMERLGHRQIFEVETVFIDGSIYRADDL
jgi:hypothetical protein